MNPFVGDQSRFLEAPLVRQADGKHKNVINYSLFLNIAHTKSKITSGIQPPLIRVFAISKNLLLNIERSSSGMSIFEQYIVHYFEDKFVPKRIKKNYELWIGKENRFYEPIIHTIIV